MNFDFVQSLFRHALTLLGGVLVTKGYIDETSASQVVGAVSTLAGIGWSYYDKR